MASARAMLVGLDSVMAWFDNNQKFPYFSVWMGKSILFSNTEDDLDKAEECLRNNIQAAIENNFTDILTLKLNKIRGSEDEAIITYNTPVYASVTFRAIEYDRSTMHPYAVDAQQRRQIGNVASNDNLLLQELQEIKARLAAIEDDDEDFDDEPQMPTLAGMINDYLTDPQMKQAIISGGINLLSKLTNMGGNNTAKQVAGIPQEIPESEDEKLVYAINIIRQHRPQFADDLVALANIAQTDPGKLNFIISMLPK